MEISSSLPQFDWAVAQWALPGESVSGDRHVVLPHRRGVTLAVIDGLGHGPEAAQAADLAAETLRLLPDSNLLVHLNCCHLALADGQLEKNFKGNDDALVLLARFKDPSDE